MKKLSNQKQYCIFKIADESKRRKVKTTKIKEPSRFFPELSQFNILDSVATYFQSKRNTLFLELETG